MREAGGPAIHSGQYLDHKARAQRRELDHHRRQRPERGGDLPRDLLAESPDHDYRLTWLDPQPRFFSMEYTELTLELTSPEYGVLPGPAVELTRARLLARAALALQGHQRNDLVDEIFDLHYRLRVQGDGPHTTLGHQHQP